MNIEAKCKNCRFCKEMTGPHDTDNYYVCMRGSLVLTIKPEENWMVLRPLYIIT